MQIDGWKYYNHAAIPTTAPHELVNIDPINDGRIWRIGGGTPLLARWTTDWDCGHETNWWYIICEGPFSIENLSRKSRKNIRKALENCEVKKINANMCIEDLWRVFQEATERYNNYEQKTTRADFELMIKNASAEWEIWAGYDKLTHRMIGYKICSVYEDWVDFTASKYSTEYLKLRVSDALNFIVLEHYLNTCGKKYVSNGTRSVVHETNVQDYYQEHFNFRKAYCKVNIKYRFPVNILVCVLFPFRNALKKHDTGKMHRIVALLTMEEIRKNC